MPPRKRKSQILEDAKRQLEALRSIDPNMDFGDGVNLVTMAKMIEEMEAHLAEHDAMVETLNESRINLEHSKKDLEFHIEHLLSEAPMLSDQENQPTTFVQVNSQVLEGINLLEEIDRILLDQETDPLEDLPNQN